MTTAAFDPYIDADDSVWAGTRRLPLDELAASSDIISVHVPMTRDTHHLVDAELISRMKRGTILVNSARGGVVDERAVIEALRDGRLGGAALDVFETEPLTAQAGARFADVTNLLLTPHIAGITDEANARVSRLTAENVRRYLS